MIGRGRSVSVRIPAELYARARSVATARGEPVTWLVARLLRDGLDGLIREALDAPPPEPPPETPDGDAA